MPTTKIILKNQECIVAVSPIISEDMLKNFSVSSSIPAINAKSIKRQCEWITTHKILEFIFGETVTYTYDKDGKPVLKNRTEHISISHCRNYCAVIINKNKPVGIDIEEPNDRIYKIADRFLTESEKMWVEESQNKTEILYLIWCAKEALYKLTDTKPDFKENLFVDKTIFGANGNLKSSIKIDTIKEQIDLHYNKSEKYMLVFTV